MRSLLWAAVVCVVLWAVAGSAQMRGGAVGGATAGGFRGTSAHAAVAARGMPATGARGLSRSASSRITVATFGTPRFRTASTPFPFHRRSPFFCFGLNCFTNGLLFDGFNRGNRFHPGFGFGFGQSPFFGGVGGWGWGYPYYADFSGWNYDEQRRQYDQEAADNQLAQSEAQDDERRQFELQRQLADQRAADETSRSRQAQNLPQSAATPTQRELTPTVLVFRDHHQVDVRSYAIAGNALYEFAEYGLHKIPLSDLDIPATVAANEERGIKFSLPKTSP